jgi:2-polyprenyl-6-methoxyphenol hydroxylase-like FAD-dependent oxidoreductase
MAKIVVMGAGIAGLTTAMLLARDGHEVTVLERDPESPPDPTTSWESWTRRGVNQFRMLHFFQPRFREIADAELPALTKAMDAAGALRFNPIRGIPAEITGGHQDGDERFEALTGRRPVIESVLARLAESTPGIGIRRGVAVAGLLTGTPTAPGVPHITGVRTDSGENIDADLVVDTTGRRSSLPTWLEGVGAKKPVEELEDSGFVYYGRHFRSQDGSTPPPIGGLLQDYGTVSMLTLPADNGTWGIGVIASGKDSAVRGLRNVDRWTAAVQSCPLVAHWLDGEALDDEVAIMAKIEDRLRTFMVDGRPVATGVLAVADSWACTNPSLGRGATIGLMHALALRDLLKSAPLDDPFKFAVAWDEVTNATVEPWYRSTLSYDRSRLADIEAGIRGETYVGDAEWNRTRALMHAIMESPECLRAFISVVTVLRLPEEVFADPAVAAKVASVGDSWRDVPSMGPTREQLLALVG